MQHLREITSDVFDIADRLKAIDGRYRLFYNLIAENARIEREKAKAVIDRAIASARI